MTGNEGNLNLVNEIDEITDILNRPIGSTICYHRGLLAFDRGAGKPPAKKTPTERAVDEVGAIAWSLHEAGRVVLMQKRIGLDDYKYLAQRVA